MLAAVVLAAGASTRMGRPKALLEWGGQSFLRRVVGLAEGCGCAPIVVVEGAIALPGAELGSARRTHNERWSKGQLSSLQAGLSALSASGSGSEGSEGTEGTEGSEGTEVSGVMVLAIDRPRVLPATCRALAQAHARAPNRIWQPAHAGRRGHPIVYPRALFSALLGLPCDEGPRSWLRSPTIDALRSSVEVSDPGILENFDRPGDLLRLSDG